MISEFTRKLSQLNRWGLRSRMCHSPWHSDLDRGAPSQSQAGGAEGFLELLIWIQSNRRGGTKAWLTFFLYGGLGLSFRHVWSPREAPCPTCCHMSLQLLLPFLAPEQWKHFCLCPAWRVFITGAWERILDSCPRAATSLFPDI